MSMLPRIATASASMVPAMTAGMVEMCENDGVRNLRRKGMSLPSLAMYMPKLPRGDSTQK